MLFPKVKSDQQFFLLHKTALFYLDELFSTFLLLQLIWCSEKDLVPNICHLKGRDAEQKLYWEM